MLFFDCRLHDDVLTTRFNLRLGFDEPMSIDPMALNEAVATTAQNFSRAFNSVFPGYRLGEVTLGKCRGLGNVQSEHSWHSDVFRFRSGRLVQLHVDQLLQLYRYQRYNPNDDAIHERIRNDDSHRSLCAPSRNFASLQRHHDRSVHFQCFDYDQSERGKQQQLKRDFADACTVGSD